MLWFNSLLHMKYFLVRVWDHLILHKILVFSVKQRSTIKPSKKQQRINVPFLHYATQCIFIHIVIHIPEYPNLTYIPHNDDTFPIKTNKPKSFTSIWGTHIFVFIIFTLISKKRAHFALFSSILSYYVL